MVAAADVLAFDNYREYLQHILHVEKENAGTTLGQLAKRFGLSTSALQMVMAGSRNLSIGKALHIARALKFSEDQSRYFEALVMRDQADEIEEREYHGAKLLQLRKQRRLERVRLSDPEIFSRWYMPAVLLYLLEFVEDSIPDAAVIASDMGCSRSDVEEALRVLRGHGVVQLGTRGRFKIQADRLRSFFSQKRFMKELLDQCKSRVDADFESDRSFFSADVMTLTREEYLRFVDEFKTLTERFMSAEGAVPRERAIHQTCLCVFPVGQASPKKRS